MKVSTCAATGACTRQNIHSTSAWAARISSALAVREGRADNSFSPIVSEIRPKLQGRVPLLPVSKLKALGVYVEIQRLDSMSFMGSCKNVALGTQERFARPLRCLLRQFRQRGWV